MVMQGISYSYIYPKHIVFKTDGVSSVTPYVSTSTDIISSSTVLMSA